VVCEDPVLTGMRADDRMTMSQQGAGLPLHSRGVSDWLHGLYRLSSIKPCFDCKITWREKCHQPGWGVRLFTWTILAMAIIN
jgi:hypothetical protein